MFRLTKWYADCLAGDGSVFVAYSARLEWGRRGLAYASALRAADRSVRSRTSLRPLPPPEIDGSVARWRGPDGFAGQWTLVDPEPPRRLFESEEGAIEWEVLGRNGAAEIEWKDARGSGPGYVERLTMTVAPWRLPIRELRWGHFVSPSRSLVWIDWRGEESWSLVLHDGGASAGRVDDDGVHDFGDGGDLVFDRPEILRDGTLLSTALAPIPGVSRLFPGRILRVRETKWTGKARMTGAAGEIAEGRTVHEVVRWP